MISKCGSKNTEVFFIDYSWTSERGIRLYLSLTRETIKNNHRMV